MAQQVTTDEICNSLFAIEQSSTGPASQRRPYGRIGVLSHKAVDLDTITLLLGNDDRRCQ
jgi:hypothetical protein